MLRKRPEIPRWFANVRELAKKEWQKNYVFERDAVYLSNPAANHQIDRYIRRTILPTAVTALKGTEYRVCGEHKPTIRQEWHVRACRSVAIVIEDPKRPNIPGNYPPWHCRLEAHCYANESTHLKWYFSASLSESCEWQMVIDLLAETSRHGIPAQLSIDDEPQRKFHVVFEGGGGGDSYKHTLEDRIKLKLKGFCDFADTVYGLEADGKDRVLFRRLIKETNHIMRI